MYIVSAKLRKFTVSPTLRIVFDIYDVTRALFFIFLFLKALSSLTFDMQYTKLYVALCLPVKGMGGAAGMLGEHEAGAGAKSGGWRGEG